MDDTTKKLMRAAQEAKYLYGLGHISRAEVIFRVRPYVEHYNKRAEALAKEHGVRHKPLSIIGYLR